jgi:ubiquinol-cytochrome c reductase cytochrome c subunit
VLAAPALPLGEGNEAPMGTDTPPGTSADDLWEQGRELYLTSCVSCHGVGGVGTADGPSLAAAGEASADFYLRTGRMPLDDPHDEPLRSDSPYDQGEIAALVAYVGSLGGPGVPPAIDTAGADVARGQELFTENCAGCHQVVGQGGIMPGAVAPDLRASTPLDVAEAVDVGPYVMPTFKRLTDDDVADIAAYVTYTHDPEDRGGWGIGHIGPIPEGMVAWLLAGAALLIAIRLIGERTTR